MSDENSRPMTASRWGGIAIISAGVSLLAQSLVSGHNRTPLFYALLAAGTTVAIVTTIAAARTQRQRKVSRKAGAFEDKPAGADPHLAAIQVAAVAFAVLAMSTIVAGIAVRSFALAAGPSLVSLPILGGFTYWATRDDKD